MPESLDKKRTGTAAVITGASGCLGRELAILFSQSGHVILSGRSPERLEATKMQCKDPANTTLVYGDLSSIGTLEHLQYFADLYSARYLICCAGAYLRLPVPEMGIDCDEIIDSNLTATIKTVQAVLPVFKRLGGGTIININSLAGKNPSPNEAVYSASKHGLSGFFKALRLELRESGIRVLDVYLGALKGTLMYSREDYDCLIDPEEAAHVICCTAQLASFHKSYQIEDMTIGRFSFPLTSGAK